MIRFKLFFLIGFFLSLALPPPSSSANNPLKGRKIVIDPGHGVINFQSRIINAGKESPSGLQEHRLNMDIAQKVGELLKKNGARVFYTRTPASYWRQAYNSVEDNKARAHFANAIGAEAYISIHCDWHPIRSYHGVTTFYSKKNSRNLGATLHKSLVRTLKARDRKLVHNDFTVLDNVEMPAVLIETGFLSHWKESKKLVNPKHQEKIAQAIAAGLRSYFLK